MTVLVSAMLCLVVCLIVTLIIVEIALFLDDIGIDPFEMYLDFRQTVIDAAAKWWRRRTK